MFSDRFFQSIQTFIRRQKSGGLLVFMLNSQLSASSCVVKSGNEKENKVSTVKESTMMEISNEKSPDFASMKQVSEKKKAFFNFFYSQIKKVNFEILRERNELISIVESKGAGLSEQRKAWVLGRCQKLNRSCDQNDMISVATDLLRNTDIIPPSLALAQAANESSWGTSRFAMEGNNYFGQWCFSKGCGLVPLRRNAGSSHEVRKFDSAFDSVKSYALNINSGKVYAPLRAMRENLRKAEGTFLGHQLAPGLQKYSERGIAYVREIQSMIRSNKLEEFDALFWSELNLPDT